MQASVMILFHWVFPVVPSSNVGLLGRGSTVVCFDATNNVSVVLNSSTGRIITVRQGTP